MPYEDKTDLEALGLYAYESKRRTDALKGINNVARACSRMAEILFNAWNVQVNNPDFGSGLCVEHHDGNGSRKVTSVEIHHVSTLEIECLIDTRNGADRTCQELVERLHGTSYWHMIGSGDQRRFEEKGKAQ